MAETTICKALRSEPLRDDYRRLTSAIAELEDGTAEASALSLQRATTALSWRRELDQALAEWHAEGEINAMRHPHAARMTALARSFHQLCGVAGVDFWSPLALARATYNTSELTDAGELAARFVLKVWNKGFPCPDFDAFEALARWDAKQRTAFVAWARAPWWP